MPFLIPCLLLFAAISFGLGISLPLVKFEKLYFFEESPSLIGLFQGLWTEGNIAIALALFVFSLLFPGGSGNFRNQNDWPCDSRNTTRCLVLCSLCRVWSRCSGPNQQTIPQARPKSSRTRSLNWIPKGSLALRRARDHRDYRRANAQS